MRRKDFNYLWLSGLDILVLATFHHVLIKPLALNRTWDVLLVLVLIFPLVTYTSRVARGLKLI